MRGWHKKPLTLGNGETILWHVFEHMKERNAECIGSYDAIKTVRELIAQIIMRQHGHDRAATAGRKR